MIRLERLSKTFRGRPAVQALSLEIQPGEIFGLLGHNGAGKSTLFGMILGQIHPSGGEALIRGCSVQRDRTRALRNVGAIFETPAFYDYLSGWENLRIFTGYSGPTAPETMRKTVQMVGLEERIHDPVRVYSHGMRQRLALAQALLPRSEIILLDEPTEGLDPEGICEMRELILRLNRECGITVILSSHLLAEVKQLCQRVAILNQGRLIYAGNWNAADCGSPQVHLEVDDWPTAARVIKIAGGTVIGANQLIVGPQGDIADIVAALVGAGVRVRAVEPVKPTLEQIYLNAIASA
ncbi:MAG: ABC transporter ATP-binding protein [Chthoniobacteraceae bacterium]